MVQPSKNIQQYILDYLKIKKLKTLKVMHYLTTLSLDTSNKNLHNLVSNFLSETKYPSELERVYYSKNRNSDQVNPTSSDYSLAESFSIPPPPMIIKKPGCRTYKHSYVQKTFSRCVSTIMLNSHRGHKHQSALLCDTK